MRRPIRNILLSIGLIAELAVAAALSACPSPTPTPPLPPIPIPAPPEPAPPVPTPVDGAIPYETFTAVNAGMTEAQVIALMGAPQLRNDVGTNEYDLRWARVLDRVGVVRAAVVRIRDGVVFGEPVLF